MSGIGRQSEKFSLRPYVIYYAVEDGEVSIIRVLHGARDSRRSF